MKPIYHIILILSLVALTSCKQTFPLSGKLNNKNINNWQSTIYLIQPNTLNDIASSYAGQLVDSTTIDKDGFFMFNDSPITQPEKSTLYLLAVQKKGQQYFNQLENENLPRSNYMPIIVEKGKPLSLTANIDHFQASCQFENASSENNALIQLRDIRLKAYQDLTSKKYPSEDEYIIAKAEALHRFQQPLIDFAHKTPYFYPALVAIRWVSPQNDYERIPEFLYEQCNKWTNSSQHIFAKQLCQKAAPQTLPILVGKTIPDMDLPMADKTTKRLSQLMGKRLTLIDFWASWCAPCRKENKKILAPLWDNMHDKGFQIIGYALESDNNSWQNAIQKDGANRWKHASHLQGDEAPLMDLFRIQTIPANFLVDENGKVVAKNLHGDNLINFVKNYLK